jgi:hypothetical protein
MHFQIDENNSDADFGIQLPGLAFVDIAHLLAGNCSIQVYQTYYDKNSKWTFVQKRNSNFKKLKSNQSTVIRILYDQEKISIVKLRRLIKKRRYKNREFYESLRDELTATLIYKEQGLVLLSFLHLYRIIEHLSIAAPLIYAAKATDFSSTGTFLADVVANKKSGLGVLKALVTKLFDDGLPSTPNFDIRFRGFDEDLTKRYFNHFKYLFHTQKELTWNDDEFSIEIPAKYFLDVAVTTRNKLFHYYQNDRNADVSKSAALCAIADAMLPAFLEWITDLLVKIITWDLDRGS